MSHQPFTIARPSSATKVLRTAGRVETKTRLLHSVATGALIALAALALALMAGCASPPQTSAPARQAARPAQPIDPATAAAVLAVLASGDRAAPVYAAPQPVYSAPPPAYAPPPVFSLAEPQAPQPTIWRPAGFEHLNH